MSPRPIFIVLNAIPDNILHFVNFCFVSIPLPLELWTLLTEGVGGYTIGRSAEKVVGNQKNNISG